MGNPGRNGKDGDDGDGGHPGEPGAIGPPGGQGTQGVQGVSGEIGPPGPPVCARRALYSYKVQLCLFTRDHLERMELWEEKEREGHPDHKASQDSLDQLEHRYEGNSSYSWCLTTLSVFPREEMEYQVVKDLLDRMGRQVPMEMSDHLAQMDHQYEDTKLCDILILICSPLLIGSSRERGTRWTQGECCKRIIVSGSGKI